MTSSLLQLGSKARMYRIAGAITPDGPWHWSEFERRLGRELGGVTISYIEWDEFTSGELSGAAVWSHDRSRAAIVVPSKATFLHKIHIAGHEAWHLLEGHDGCNRRAADERSAELFATRVGTHVNARQSRRDREAANLASVFGVAGLGA